MTTHFPRPLLARATLLLAVALAGPLPAEPPRFTRVPPSEDRGFTGSLYEAIVTTSGCPPPEVVVEAPPGAVYRDDVLSWLAAGSAGDRFGVRLRARNRDGEAVASWHVTLVAPVDLEFTDPADATAGFVEEFGRVPAALRPGLQTVVRGGDLAITLPPSGPDAGGDLDSWCGYDRSPRWLASAGVSGAFEIEATLHFLVPPGDPAGGYHVGLALDRGDEDLTILGPIRNRIEFERTCWPARDGDHSPAPLLEGHGLEEVRLRVRVEGERQSFFVAGPLDDVWQLAGTIEGSRPALVGVGIAAKTWGGQSSLTFALRDFHYRGIALEPPRLLDIPSEIDYAFADSEYSVAPRAASRAPATLEVLAPAGAALGPDGVLRLRAPGPAGRRFPVEVRATNAAGEDRRAWLVEVVDPVRLDFEAPGELEELELQAGDSSRLDEVGFTVQGGELLLSLPDARPEDFDSWCGFDRSPRWLLASRVVGSYALQTRLGFATPPGNLADGYHVGLALDRGFADLGLLGAIRQGVEYERACACAPGAGVLESENTETVLAGFLENDDPRVDLRIESDGAEERYLARAAGDPDWTLLARVRGRRPRPLGVGVGAKDFLGEGPFTAAFEFLDYGPPGCSILSSPPDAEIVRGELYAPPQPVAARGVAPRFSLLDAPAAAVIDERTGEVRWPAPPDQAPGPVSFTAAATCGTATDTASWTVTVRAPQPRVLLSSIEPAEISVLGETPFTARGANFTPSTRVVFSPTSVAPVFVDATMLRGTAPAHPAGPVDVAVEDPAGGSDVLEAAVRYIGPLSIEAIDPPAADEGEAVTVTITGVAFTPQTRITVGGAPLQSAVFGNARAMRGRVAGTLPPGLHDVVATDGEVLATASGAFTVRAVHRPELSSIEPLHLSSRGGTPVVIRGRNFTADMRITFESGGVATALEFELEGDSVARGEAPDHPLPGPVEVVVRDARGDVADRLSGAAYDNASLLGPDEIEATLVGGIAQLQWVDPLAYDTIHVYRDGQRIASIPGNVTFFEDPDPVEGLHASYTLVGETSNGSFSVVPFQVVVPLCPEPVLPVADRGERVFHLNGGHPGYGMAAGGGGASGGEPGSGGGGPPGPVPVNAQGLSLVLKTNGQAAYNTIDAGQFFLGYNELVSGFTLFEEARKLRIEVHGAKIRNAADLSLRVYLERVGGGRSVELELPDPLLTPTHQWIDFTYNTLNPPPPPGQALPPDPPLPAGLYRVHLYASGGLFGQPHYSISSDFSQDQILVPGVGCPPYPLIRVTDTTEKNSNPVIESIEQFGEAVIESWSNGKDLDVEGNPIPIVRAKIRAVTSDPDVPADPIWRYEWEVEATTESKKKITASPETFISVPGWGYYKVTLTVLDQRCGFAIRTLPVKIFPPCVPPPPQSCGPGLPAGATCPNVTFPTPRPDELHFVSDLPGGMDDFSTAIPGTFHVFVVDETCSGQNAVTKSVQLGLFATDASSAPIHWTDGAEAVVPACLVNEEDECTPEDQLDDAFWVDGRFWKAVFPDLRLLPDPIPVLIGRRGFSLKARGSSIPENTSASAGWGPWRAVSTYTRKGGNLTEISGANRLNVVPKPAFLDFAPAETTGSYEPKLQRYEFLAGMVSSGASGVAIPETKPFGLPFGATFPALDNEVKRAGQRVALSFTKGSWLLDSHRVETDALLLNGEVGGEVELLGPAPGGGAGGGGAAGAGEGAGFDPTLLAYDYCQRSALFRDRFQWPILDTIIWTGAIGPIYVTVRATVNLALSIALEQQIELHLRGFPGAGEDPYRADDWILPQATLALDAGIRSDIFFGILSVRGGVGLDADYTMPFRIHVGPEGLVGPAAAARLTLGADLWFKGCVSLVLKDICVNFSQPLFGPKALFNDVVSATALPAGFLDPPSGCGGGGGAAGFTGAGAGAPVVLPVEIQLNASDHQIEVASSPGGTRQVVVGRFAELSTPGVSLQLASLHRSSGQGWKTPPDATLGGLDQGLQSDPAAVFLDESHVLCAWTQDLSAGTSGVPTDPADLVDPTEFNAVTSHYEIVYKVGVFIPDPDPTGSGEVIDWGDPFTESPSRLTSDPESDPRADGSVSLARVPGGSTLWAVWVRWESAAMAIPVDPPEEDPCWKGPPPAEPPLITSRVDLHATSIVARRLTGGLPSGPLYSVSGPAGAIDIEPRVAASPEGDVFSVWITDTDPTHVDLTTSNAGRNILFSRFDGAAWSAPQPVIADVSALPGVLEPSLALVGGGRGALAFTALPANAESCDTGLGNSRLLYVVFLSGGDTPAPAWSAPVLIEKKCDTPVFVHWPLVLPSPGIDVPVHPGDPMISPVVLVANETGVAGTGLSLGNVVSVTLDPSSEGVGLPATLTAGGDLHQDVAAAVSASGELIAVSQSISLTGAGGGGDTGAEGTGSDGGGGETVALAGDLSILALPLVADPAITACRISAPGAGPGSRVSVSVTVANRGFAATPVADGGEGELWLRTFFESGDARVEVEETRLPPLPPGRETVVDFALEVPRQPVLLVAEVDGVEGERDPSDDRCVRPLGAPLPREVSCSLLEREGERPAVRVQWLGGGLYDGFLVYRDGCLLAEAPASARSYLDTGVTLVARDGSPVTREYGVRAIRGESRSVAAICTAEIPAAGTASSGRFRRGDANADRRFDISDAIATLSFLFQGGSTPPCLDAADANDDGRVDISDGIYPLRFLFTGGAPLPAPGPEVCGGDPTPDALPPCRYGDASCR